MKGTSRSVTTQLSKGKEMTHDASAAQGSSQAQEDILHSMPNLKLALCCDKM
jgi:hypothetical protein